MGQASYIPESYRSSSAKENDYCVIKILTVHATNEHQTRRSQEISALEAVKPGAPLNNLPVLHDNFIESSHHGNHLCIATLEIRPDIDNTLRLQAPQKFLRVHIVKRIIASVGEALHNFHTLDFIHGGTWAGECISD